MESELTDEHQKHFITIIFQTIEKWIFEMIDPNQAQNFMMNLTPEEENSRPMTSSQ